MKNIKKRDSRKILLFLPILMFPFLAMAFYTLDGGKGIQEVPVKNVGIRSVLPEASFGKEKQIDKMGIYQQGQKDSSKFGATQLEAVAGKLGFTARSEEDPTKDIDLKLQQLQAQINAPVEKAHPGYLRGREISVPGMSSEVARLEKLMSSMQGSPGEDQEMKQLSGMLEKVLDIQHPERIRDAYINRVNAAPQEKFAAIPAKVSGNQRILQGAALKLTLSDTVSINGILIPKGQELYGLCNLTNQRLLVEIKTIRMANDIIPVDLSVYSLDGIKGIAAPDAIVDNAISGGADDAVRSLQLLTMDQSVGVQVAGAGIDAAKGLFSKKVRRIRMKVRAGFPVLLRDNQIKKY